jgi:RNA polymerase primary sigma factor
MVEVINKLGRIQRELLQDFGREPTLEELAKEMDITPVAVLELQRYAREPISLDQTLGEEGNSRLGDFIEDSEAVIAVEAVSFTLLQDDLRSVLATLSEREAGIVQLRFGLEGQPRTLDERSATSTGSPGSGSGKSRPRRWPNCAIPRAPRRSAITLNNTESDRMYTPRHKGVGTMEPPAPAVLLDLQSCPRCESSWVRCAPRR